ncbi:MAG TPA: cation:proton antiporter [Planctomycetota bacterium]|nr:cation:proton antiporter [Planctomycetota bacterium]
MTWTESEFATLLAGLSVLLVAARVLGEVAQRLRQAAVVGEILAGVLLGPTVLGALLPELQAALFPATGPVPIALEAIGVVAITLFLLVAGIEIDLSAVWRQGRAALWLGVVGIAVPFATGFVPAWFASDFLGASEASQRLPFALFFATAMAITALPVLAKILYDLRLLRTELGVVLIAAAILNDLAGWLVFVLVLSTLGGGHSGLGVAGSAVAVVLLAAGMLTVGRWVLHRALPYVQAHTSWPGGVLGLAVGGGLACAALTQWLGVHAVFGAFLFGVAVGDSEHLRQSTRTTIERFVSFLFAPLFFASIGLRLDFVRHFDLALVLVVLGVATFGKVVGCGLAARHLGFVRRQWVAIGFGMNARGAMEIVLGTIALRVGLIGERLFVALVIMALVTSITTGWILQRLMRQRRELRFVDFVAPEAFVPDLRLRDPVAAIEALADRAAAARGLDAALVREKVMAREDLVSSAFGQGLAVPHARIPGLAQAVIAVGLAREGLEFDAPDDEPVRVVLVVLTPEDDPEVHLGILADVARRLRSAEAVRDAAACANLTQFRAFLNIQGLEAA